MPDLASRLQDLIPHRLQDLLHSLLPASPSRTKTTYCAQRRLRRSRRTAQLATNDRQRQSRDLLAIALRRHGRSTNSLTAADPGIFYRGRQDYGQWGSGKEAGSVASLSASSEAASDAGSVADASEVAATTPLAREPAGPQGGDLAREPEAGDQQVRQSQRLLAARGKKAQLPNSLNLALHLYPDTLGTETLARNPRNFSPKLDLERRRDFSSLTQSRQFSDFHHSHDHDHELQRSELSQQQQHHHPLDLQLPHAAPSTDAVGRSREDGPLRDAIVRKGMKASLERLDRATSGSHAQGHGHGQGFGRTEVESEVGAATGAAAESAGGRGGEGCGKEGEMGILPRVGTDEMVGGWPWSTEDWYRRGHTHRN